MHLLRDPPSRLGLIVLRNVPEFVWALVFVRVVGLGPTAGVLGFVGAGGLGQVLVFHMGLFHMGKTASVQIAMPLLGALVDALSYGLRRLLMR